MGYQYLGKKDCWSHLQFFPGLKRMRGHLQEWIFIEIPGTEKSEGGKAFAKPATFCLVNVHFSILSLKQTLKPAAQSFRISKVSSSGGGTQKMHRNSQNARMVGKSCTPLTKSVPETFMEEGKSCSARIKKMPHYIALKKIIIIIAFSNALLHPTWVGSA